MRTLKPQAPVAPAPPPFAPATRRGGFAAVLLLLAAGAAIPFRLTAAPAPASAPPASSPDDALRSYRRGRFAESQNQYSSLAQERPEDARLRFNAGTAAYRQSDLTNAARWFESVVSAPDLKLQQQAYYNLGNTRYRLGESVQDPQGRQKLWEEAITNFTAATKLDAKDTNAAHNLAYLRRKLEELQQQMPPPQQQQQKDQQKKDQNDKKDQDSKDSSQSQDGGSQEKSDDQSNASKESNKSEGQDPSKSRESEDRSGSKKDDPAGQQSGQEKSEKPQGNPDDAGQKSGQADGREGKEGQDTKSGAEAKEGSEGGQQAADQQVGEAKPGEMSKAQAVQLLENQKGDEKALMLRAYSGTKEAERASRVRKPW